MIAEEWESGYANGSDVNSARLRNTPRDNASDAATGNDDHDNAAGSFSSTNTTGSCRAVTATTKPGKAPNPVGMGKQANQKLRCLRDS